MSEELLGGLIVVAFTTLVSAVGWWIRKLITEKDQLEARLELVEAKYVTEDEIRRLEDRIDMKLDGFCRRISSLDQRITERLDKVLEYLATRSS